MKPEHYTNAIIDALTKDDAEMAKTVQHVVDMFVHVPQAAVDLAKLIDDHLQAGHTPEMASADVRVFFRRAVRVFARVEEARVYVQAVLAILTNSADFQRAWAAVPKGNTDLAMVWLSEACVEEWRRKKSPEEGAKDIAQMAVDEYHALLLNTATIDRTH